MQIHHLTQGSAEWHAHRAAHFNASDAPAMMGCSPYKTRAELLDELSGALSPEISADTQRIFNDGHRAEALARPLAQEIVGEELFPCVGTLGRYSASFDGITMDERTGFEHKLLGATLRAAFADIETVNPEHREATAGRLLPLHYRVQMEHQCMVGNLDRILFMASMWGADDGLIAEHDCWYYPDAKLREQLVAGWDQFERDLQAHVPAAKAAPKPQGATPETLPALRIEVTGQVTASNLDAFKTHALQVFGGIKRDLVTDQDFADAEATVKWCTTVEERLAAAKQHALSQTESIDALFRAIDDISAEARRVRLDLDKTVKARKEQIRQDIAADARRALHEHVAGLNAELAGIVSMTPPAGFVGEVADAMKGKRTVDTLRDAATTALARAKADATQLADRYRVNAQAMGAQRHLFPDFAAIGAKAPEDFEAVLELRVRQAQDAAERVERERQEAEARRQAQAAAAAAQPPTVPPAPQVAPQSAPAVAPAPAPVPAASESATLPLGKVCERLGLTVTADALEQLGFPAHRDRSARLYRESDFPRICDALVAHIARQRQAFTRTAQAALI